MAERCYQALEKRDMTRHELSKVMGVTTQNAIHAITSATYIYPDIYEYDKIRGNSKAVVIGLIRNYKGVEVEGIHLTPRSNDPLEKRLEKLKVDIKKNKSECRWIIVCDLDGNWLYDTNLFDFAKKIGVSAKEVNKAIHKGTPIKGYLVDLDLF